MMKDKIDLKLIVGYLCLIVIILATLSMLNLMIIQEPIMNRSWNMTITFWNSTDTIWSNSVPSGIPVTNIFSLLYLVATLITYVVFREAIVYAVKDMKARFKVKR